MESIKVTPEQLERKADLITDAAGNYYGKYRALLGDVETLTETDYKGDDANAFRDKVKAFKPDFDKMKKLMDEYAGFLRQAAKNYRDTQERVKSSANALR